MIKKCLKTIALIFVILALLSCLCTCSSSLESVDEYDWNGIAYSIWCEIVEDGHAVQLCIQSHMKAE